nr:hypothetical protein [Tanacetum cinerariifolium]
LEKKKGGEGGVDGGVAWSRCGDVGKAAAAMLMVGVVFDGGSGGRVKWGAWGRVIYGIE